MKMVRLLEIEHFSEIGLKGHGFSRAVKVLKKLGL
jgi:hypothetical protein